MDQVHSNIVQVEFFQVNVRAHSWGALMEDIKRRRADDAQLKITLRFFDEKNQLTSYVLKLKRLERWKQNLENQVVTTTGWRQEIANSLHHLLLGWIQYIKEECIILAAQQLHEVAEASGQIAIEQWDRSFRLLQRNEIYETLTAIEKAKGAWVFVFEPNHLLSDQNVTVSYVM